MTDDMQYDLFGQPLAGPMAGKGSRPVFGSPPAPTSVPGASAPTPAPIPAPAPVSTVATSPTTTAAPTSVSAAKLAATTPALPRGKAALVTAPTETDLVRGQALILLLEAMRQTTTAALGRFVRAGRESLCLVRARGDALALETLFLAEDVHSQAEIAEAIGETDVKDSELELARQVIESLAGDFEPSELASEYRRDLKAMLEAKLRGEEIAVPKQPEEEAPVIDLMEALKASVAAAKKPDAAKPAASKSKARRKARAS